MRVPAASSEHAFADGASLSAYFLRRPRAVQSTFNAVLYGWTPEAFPAAVRDSACGLASFWGRLSSIVAPLVAARLGSSTGVLYLAGGGVFLSTVCALFLPETSGGEVL